MSKTNSDNRAYIGFTGPQRLNRAVHELEGILLGITADLKVNDRELARLTHWIGEHREFQSCAPFKETVDVLRMALSDAVFSADELADLMWMSSRFKEENEFYCQLTADMQRLQGLLAGAAADATINRMELDAIRDWMDHRQGLKGCWPYDEIDALITHVLQDGKISVEEHGALIRYFDEFALSPGRRAVELKEDLKDYGIAGICAVAPEISFPGKKFCFTGTSKKAARAEIAAKVKERGGLFLESLNRSANYLVVGADGNPCWAFSCYGRKVEDAMNYRKEGVRILIVHEVDFWDHLN